VLPQKAAGSHERDFTDGLETSLPALAIGITDETAHVNLQKELTSIAHHAADAQRMFSMENPSASAPALLAGFDETRHLLAWVYAAPSGAAKLTPTEMNRLLPALQTKVDQFERAANFALGVHLEASVDPPGPPPPPTPFLRFEQSQ